VNGSRQKYVFEADVKCPEDVTNDKKKPDSDSDQAEK
jgi:hypothetical protein